MECLHKNVESVDNVLVYGHVVLGAEKGSCGLVEVTSNSGNTRVAGPKDGDAHPRIAMYPFDEIWDDRHEPIDFMKIDVEGYELEVVRGAKHTIQRNKPVMVVEQKRGNAEVFGFRTTEVIDLLQTWGAKIAWIRSGDYCLTWS